MNESEWSCCPDNDLLRIGWHVKVPYHNINCCDRGDYLTHNPINFHEDRQQWKWNKLTEWGLAQNTRMVELMAHMAEIFWNESEGMQRAVIELIKKKEGL